MGKRQWDRGSAVIRRQADADVAAMLPRIESQAMRDRIRELEATIAEMQASHERQLNRARICVALQREREERLRAEIEQLKSHGQILKDMCRRLMRRLKELAGKRRILSQVIRHTLSPSEYREAREAIEELSTAVRGVS